MKKRAKHYYIGDVIKFRCDLEKDVCMGEIYREVEFPPFMGNSYDFKIIKKSVWCNNKSGTCNFDPSCDKKRILTKNDKINYFKYKFIGGIYGK